MLFTIVSPCQILPEVRKPYGGTFRWGVYHKPSTIINPIFTTQTVCATLIQLIFNGLVRINPRGEVEPDLAQSWDISGDGLVYTFHLRKGVKFHDGQECTARDVKFTYDAMTDPAVNSPFRGSFQIIRDFKVEDRYTFRVALKEPSTSFIYRMIRYILPEHADRSSHPIGTGPFKFKERTKDDQIILEFNPDYYEGRPYLDKIVVKTYPNSEDLWAGLMRGEVDCSEFIEKKDYEVIRNDSSFKAYAFAADGYYALRYNLNGPIPACKKIREAIALAVDRRSLIKRAGGGYGMECAGPFHPQSFGFNPDVVPFEYNPQKAQAILAELGWQDKDNDGILEKNGDKLELNVLVDPRNDIYEKIIKVLRQQLQQVGIRINAQFYGNGGTLAKEFLARNKVQACLTFLLASADPDQETDVWSSGGREKINESWLYKNEEVDELFSSARMTRDKERRKAIYQKIHQLIYQDQPACFLYFPFVFHAISAEFKNTDAYFNVNMPNYVIKDFFVDDTSLPEGKRER